MSLMEKREKRLRDALKYIKQPVEPTPSAESKPKEVKRQPGGYKRRSLNRQKTLSEYAFDAVFYPAIILYYIGEKVWRALDFVNWGFIAPRVIKGSAIALLGVGLYKGSPTMLEVAQDKFADYQESRLENKLLDYQDDFESIQKFVAIPNWIEADGLSEKLQRELAGESDDWFDSLFSQVSEYDDEVVDPGYEQFQLEIRVAEMQTQTAVAITAIPTPLPEVTLEATIEPTLAPDEYPPVFISEQDGGVYISDGVNVSLVIEKSEDAVWELAVLSPDERRLLLVERVEKFLTSMCNIYVINSDGSRLSYLEDTDSGWCFVDMFWTDNDSIIYQYGRNNGEMGVRWQTDIDENNIGINRKRYELND